MTSPLLTIEGLHARFGDNEVLHGIDLEVAPQEVVAIIGPSGCGKTTLLRCINLLERPSGGRVVVAGHVMAEETARGMRFPGARRFAPLVRTSGWYPSDSISFPT